MNYYEEGIFTNYIRAFPSEMDRMFQAIAYIVDQGIGGDILDEITRKSFRDTNEKYMNRLQKAALDRKDGFSILYRALLKWADSWKESFGNITEVNAVNKYKEKPLHTWFYCLISGKSYLFDSLINEEKVSVAKEEWEETRKIANQNLRNQNTNKQEKLLNYQNDKIKRLLKLYEKDKEVQMKELLFERKIAVFNESKWNEEQINSLIRNYNFGRVDQFSALNLATSNIGIYDYYIFITTQASHSVKNQLDSRVPKEKVFLINYNNSDRVINEFISQLKGKLSNDKK